MKVGTVAFDKAWKAEAGKHPQKFTQAQHAYIQKNHYQPAVNSIKKAIGFDTSKYPKAVQDVVWSVGVQHGAAGAAKLFKNAGIKQGMSAKDVINKLYDERSKVDKYFSSSSTSIKKGVQNRFVKERQDALRMLG